MKSVLQQQRSSSILIALLTIVLGVTLLLWPGQVTSLLCTLLGGSLLLFGGLYVVSWLIHRRNQTRSTFLVIPGVILAGLGVWLMISAETAVTLVQYVVGALVLFHGILDLQGAVALLSQKMDKWWIELLFGIATFGLGLLVLANPLGSFSLLLTLIGGVLIFDGISDLWIIWRLRAAEKLALLPPPVVELDPEQEAQTPSSETEAHKKETN